MSSDVYGRCARCEVTGSSVSPPQALTKKGQASSTSPLAKALPLLRIDTVCIPGHGVHQCLSHRRRQLAWTKNVFATFPARKGTLCLEYFQDSFGGGGPSPTLTGHNAHFLEQTAKRTSAHFLERKSVIRALAGLCSDVVTAVALPNVNIFPLLLTQVAFIVLMSTQPQSGVIRVLENRVCDLLTRLDHFPCSAQASRKEMGVVPPCKRTDTLPSSVKDKPALGWVTS